MKDVLADLSPLELSAFYYRLADIVEKNRGDLKMSLAALFMRHWLENRDPKSTFNFDAPGHLINHVQIFDVLEFHRKVYLSQEKAHFTGGSKKLVGVLPRLLGQPPFQKWDAKRPLTMNYESLVEIPLRYQLTGSDGDKDLLYSLRGFQLKSSVNLAAEQPLQNGKLKIVFQSFQAEIRDRYDWDYSEHITVPNPDYESTKEGALEPELKSIVVYHKNAKRLEDAGLAAPYDVKSKPWQVTDYKLTQPAEIKIK